MVSRAMLAARYRWKEATIIAVMAIDRNGSKEDSQARVLEFSAGIYAANGNKKVNGLNLPGDLIARRNCQQDFLGSSGTITGRFVLESDRLCEPASFLGFGCQFLFTARLGSIHRVIGP
jgi:hypothetical protein